MRKVILLFLFIISQANILVAQEIDTLPYRLVGGDVLPYHFFKEQVVLLADIGFNSAPFAIKDNYSLGVKKIKYRNNIRPTLGIGVSHKWFGIRVGLTLPLNVLDENKFGNSNYFDITVKANIKKTFCSFSFRNYQGYAVKGAYQFNDSISQDTPNAIMPLLRSTSLSTNVWYFRDDSFKMQAFQGKTAHFTRESKTWYLKGSLNFFRVSNESATIIPSELTDTTDRKNAQRIGAIDLGIIPGYAYGNRINNWQYGIFLGLGGVIQSKYYTKDGNTRSFLGLAPRVDFKISGGYSQSNFFILLISDFDIKSLKIQSLNYNQTYYNVRIMSGFRLQTKKPRKRDS